MGENGDKSRVSVVKWKGRYLFLVDGRGDAVFDKSWGITTFAPPEEAQRVGELYLLADSQGAL